MGRLSENIDHVRATTGARENVFFIHFFRSESSFCRYTFAPVLQRRFLKVWQDENSRRYISGGYVVHDISAVHFTGGDGRSFRANIFKEGGMR